MIDPSDSYAFVARVPLGPSGNPVGMAILRYEVSRYRDIRNLQDQLAYQIRCTQRIIIPNSTPYVPGPQNVTSFNDYPALLTSNISLSTNCGVDLQSYSPKTLNSSVTTSVSNGAGTVASTSHQHTSGSTTSQSNSFGASVSLGFFGDAPTGGVSADYSHSWGSSRSKSNATGSGFESSSNRSADETMTVKDWACYSYLDPLMTSPTWVWGQEYPWNVVQFNNTSTATPTANSAILLPGFVTPLLCDDTQALPPSELSRFGLDFTMKAQWIVDIGHSTDTVVAFKHAINYLTASHAYVGGPPPSVIANLGSVQPFTLTGISIDLCAYGLDPIGIGRGADGGAVIGFIPNKFIVQPTPATASATPVKFRTLSTSNNLMIGDATDYSGLTAADAGAGFSVSETTLTATFSPNCTKLVVNINFKIIDTSNTYNLFFKHWKTGQTGVMLRFCFNGDNSNIITKYVDAVEAEGGDNNMTSIALRNLDYGSINFHDYLQLGYNTIEVEVTPIGGSAGGCSYQIRAISIEQG